MRVALRLCPLEEHADLQGVQKIALSKSIKDLTDLVKGYPEEDDRGRRAGYGEGSTGKPGWLRHPRDQKNQVFSTLQHALQGGQFN